MNKETTDRVNYIESLAYVYFVCQNSKHLKQISKNPDFFGSWDASGVTKTNRKFIIEFKIRDIYAKDFSGKTMIENVKLQALQAIWEQDKRLEVLYICYFNDFYISFNLSQRFKQRSNSDILCTYDINCKRSTYGDQKYNTEKRVNFLCFNKDFRDKISKYE